MNLRLAYIFCAQRLANECAHRLPWRGLVLLPNAPLLRGHGVVDAKTSRACDKQHEETASDGEIFAEKCVLQVLRCFRKLPITVFALSSCSS